MTYPGQEPATPDACKAVDGWNGHVEVGAPVRYWRGAREGEGLLGRTRSTAQLLGDHTPVVWIEGCSGCIALTHVELLTEEDYKAAKRRAPEPPGGAVRPTIFDLVRDADVSGVSGVGRVAEGVIWSDGEAAIHWLGRFPTTTPHPKGIVSVKEVHGHGGSTRIVLNDPADRLAAIARAHSKEVLAGGLTSGLCVECGHPDPCPTKVWATTERDVNATWDPADDEPEEELS
jgi:hypothetical protein